MSSKPIFLWLYLVCGFAYTMSANALSISEYQGSWEYKTLMHQQRLDINEPLSKASFIHAHNAYNSSAYTDFWTYLDPNHTMRLEEMLDMGVRSLELDAHKINGNIVLCHAGGDDIGCTGTERDMQSSLEDIDEWLMVNPNEVIIIYLEDYMDDDYNQSLSDIVDSGLGAFLYETGGLGCEYPPMDISKQDILNAGKQVVMFTTGSDCGKSEPTGFTDVVFDGGFKTDNGLVTTGQCYDKYDERYFHDYWVRVFEDLTWNGNAFGDPLNLNADDIVVARDCGVTIFGLDMLVPGDARMGATLWSWDVNEPAAVASVDDCAVMNSEGRFEDAACSASYQHACKNLNTQEWLVSEERGVWGSDLCASGYQFSVPTTALDKVRLQAAKSNSGAGDLWLNYTDQVFEGEWISNEETIQENERISGWDSSWVCGVVPGDSGHMADKPQKDDHVGKALASGDFNGDGYADLAIGAPNEDINGNDDAGAVNIVYGSTDGLQVEAGNCQIWHGDSPGLPGSAEADDQFGYALTSADFNKDGFDDLAIGAPDEDLSAADNDDEGIVFVLYGTSIGLTSAGSMDFHQDSEGIADSAEANDKFGFSLTNGDFNNDGYPDLAVGTPYEDLTSGGNDNDGAVYVLFGGGNGISSINSQIWNQDSSGVNSSAEKDDKFGWAVAAGDFDKDGYDDLAIGAPNEDTSGDNAGYVNVLFGTSSGLTGSGDQSFSQDSSGIAGSTEDDDHFGYSLAVGDFDNDGYADLAIGSPKEDLGSGGNNNDGMVHVLFGGSSGLSGSGSQDWHQDSANVNGSAEKDDHFGWSLAAGDYDGDGIDDLAIGSPREDVSGSDDAGYVNVLFGTSSGLTGSSDQSFSQDSTGMPGSSEVDDNLGYALAAGDFNGDGYVDLAVGSPKEDLSVGGNNNDGTVYPLHGGSGGLAAQDYDLHQ